MESIVGGELASGDCLLASTRAHINTRNKRHTTSHYAQQLMLNHDNNYVAGRVSAINAFLLLF